MKSHNKTNEEIEVRFTLEALAFKIFQPYDNRIKDKPKLRKLAIEIIREALLAKDQEYKGRIEELKANLKEREDGWHQMVVDIKDLQTKIEDLETENKRLSADNFIQEALAKLKR